MKKLLLSAVLCAFTLSNLYAQTKTYGTSKNIQNAKIINEVPSTPPPPPPPPPTNSKTTAPISNTNVPSSVYSLTAVKVNIRTGADNKEYPSGVIVWLFSMGVEGGFVFTQSPENLRNEMKINSNTEFGLEKDLKTDPKAFTLEAFQKIGLGLRFRYLPNLPLDAWKIEGISITLEFRDQSGNLHPTFGSKTIVFNNAYGFLNYWDTDLFCKTDTYFNPLTAVISPH